MAQQVQITDNITVAGVDSVGKTLNALELPHSRVHEGIMYQASTITSSLADGANVDMLMIIGSTKHAHTVFNINTTGNAWGYLYENPTTTNNGTQLSTPNLDRNSSNTADTKVYAGPTVGAVGTNLAESVIPGGEKKDAIGAQLRDVTEWILKAGNTYLLRATNQAGNAKDISMETEFYEVLI